MHCVTRRHSPTKHLLDRGNVEGVFIVKLLSCCYICLKEHVSHSDSVYYTYVTSTAKQVLGNCERIVLANFIGKAVNLYFVVMLYYAVKLFIYLSYFSDCQPLYCTCSLVYWCTVHAKSFMKHACVMFCPCMYLKYCMKKSLHFKYVI